MNHLGEAEGMEGLEGNSIVGAAGDGRWRRASCAIAGPIVFPR
jgi:hypothetical protein